MSAQDHPLSAMSCSPNVIVRMPVYLSRRQLVCWVRLMDALQWDEGEG